MSSCATISSVAAVTNFVLKDNKRFVFVFCICIYVPSPIQGGAMNHGLLFAGPPPPLFGGSERKD
jgi:hypothetical protein